MIHRPTKKELERRFARAESASTDAELFVARGRDWLMTQRDGRGTTAEAIKQAFNGCVRFEKVLHARSHHSDSEIKRMAKKVVKAVRHENFPEILRRLSKFHGRLSRAGRHLAEQRRQDDEQVVELNQQFELRELRSVTSLRRVGRTLGICVKKESWAREYLADPDAKMWKLVDREPQRPLCLLKVNTTTREIVELEGEGGSTPRLKRRLAFEILKALGVSGDDERAFAQVGAFQAFLSGGLTTAEPIEAEGSSHWVWSLRGGDEVVIATKRPDKRKRWSRFLRSDAETVGHRRRRHRRGGFVGGFWNHLSESELLALVIDHPSFAERLRNGQDEARLER